MGDILKAEKFFGQVDSNTPLFNRDPGWLKTLQNMRVKPGGYLEARGGYEGIRPSGGTSTPVAGSGVIGGVVQHNFPHSTMLYGTQTLVSTGQDYGDYSGSDAFGLWNAGGPNPMTAGSGWSWGATSKFGRLSIFIEQPAIGTFTITWKYSKAGGTWGTLTGPTEQFTTAGERTITWGMPSDWVPYAYGTAGTKFYRYWVRAEVTAFTNITQTCFWDRHVPFGDWSGSSDIIVGVGTPSTGGFGTPPLIYTQTTAGVVVWAGLTAGGVYQGKFPSYRFAGFQDRIYMASGAENYRLVRSSFGGSGPDVMGFTKPALSAFTLTSAPSGSNFGQNCVFDYGMTLVYGPQNAPWGESNVTMSATGPTAFVAANQAQLAWTFSSTPATPTVMALRIYRTDDLTNVPASARADQPMFLIAEVPRFHGTFPAGYNDFTYAFPFPAKELNIVDIAPPDKCKFVNTLQGRLLMANSDSFANRGWWSNAGEAEAFDQVEQFVQLDGAITGSAVAFDIWFLWSEKQMIGVSDMSEDIPNIFEVQGGTPCIAGDSTCQGYGLLFWASTDGIYTMDQSGAVRRITDDQSAVFGKMGVQTHGGSRATLHDSMYEIQLAAPDGTPVSGQSRWRYDLLTNSWSISTIAPAPLATFPAPLGHADAGVPHPIYGNVNPLVADWTLYVGEYTTTDAGSGFACIADVHFGPPGFRKYSPSRAAAYYQADNGWGTPIISAPPGASYIFGPVPTMGTASPRSGTDYKVASSNTTSKVSGVQDVVVRFSATTVGGGVVANQRLAAMYLDGDIVSQGPFS